MKRSVASAFSKTTLVELEPFTDVYIKILERKLEGLHGQVIDFGTWLHWYAFDVITSITFSRRQGFMEKESDIDGIIHATEGRLLYNSVIGEEPWLHSFLLGNRFVATIARRMPFVSRLSSVASIVRFAATQVERHASESSDATGDTPRTLLDRFKSPRNDKVQLSDADLLNHASGNV